MIDKYVTFHTKKTKIVMHYIFTSKGLPSSRQPNPEIHFPDFFKPFNIKTRVGSESHGCIGTLCS